MIPLDRVLGFDIKGGFPIPDFFRAKRFFLLWSYELSAVKADFRSALFVARDFFLLSSELPCGMEMKTIQFKQ